MAVALALLRALRQNPTRASVESAIVTTAEVGRDLAAEAAPDPAGIAAIQLVRGSIETLCGDVLASLSAEVAVLLARSVPNSDLTEHLLVDALLCAARSHRSADRLGVARLRATEALAIAQVRFDGSHPATAASWNELGNVCEALGDLTGASAAYREALAFEAP